MQLKTKCAFADKLYVFFTVIKNVFWSTGGGDSGSAGGRICGEHSECCLPDGQAPQGDHRRGEGCATAPREELEHVDAWLRHGRAATLQTGASHRGPQTETCAHPKNSQEVLNYTL
jgi:hypothetical protein